MEDYIKLNITFQEEYKRLDKLCKECFSSLDGVSEYIRQMESSQYSLQRFGVSWKSDYQMLKHIRWIRNQLSHEVGTLQSDICSQEDLDFVTTFYSKIMNCADPLAQMRILKENERKTQREKHIDSINKQTKPNEPVIKNSVFSKLLEKIKKIFFNKCSLIEKQNQRKSKFFKESQLNQVVFHWKKDERNYSCYSEIFFISKQS